MVDRRCRATLLAQTENVAGPLPARNEVNPRTDIDLSLTDIRTDTTAPLFSLMPHTPVETSSSRPAVFITHPVLQAVLTATQEMVHRMSSVVESGVQGAGCAPGERHVFVDNTENTLTGMFVYTGSILTYEAHYVYDPLSRRIKKRETDHTGGKTIIEQYVSNGKHIIMKMTVDAQSGRKKLEALYAYGNTGDDDVVVRLECIQQTCTGSPWKAYVKDRWNSVEGVMDIQRQLIEKNQVYSSYGIPLTVSEDFEFTGREYEGLGMYYYRTRYYDARVGRFMQGEVFHRKPILSVGARVRSPLERILGRGQYDEPVNGYWYGMNHPNMGTDPFGYNIYGVYCGSGSELGDGESPCDSENVPAPRYGFDACCKQHDCDYEKCNISSSFNTDEKEYDCNECCKCAVKADRKLCECAINNFPERGSPKQKNTATAIKGWACCMAGRCEPERGKICVKFWNFRGNIPMKVKGC